MQTHTLIKWGNIVIKGSVYKMHMNALLSGKDNMPQFPTSWYKHDLKQECRWDCNQI